MSSGIDVIQSIYDRIEPSKPVDLEQGVGDDVAVDRFYFYIRVKSLDGFSSNNSFGLPDVFLPEQELSIQVGDVDRVQIDHRELLAADEHQVLEELTSNTSSADDQDLAGP
jgi:hypothetical protein